MRLDRFLSEESEYTRSEIKKMIKGGQIRVNGESRIRPETKVDPDSDDIRISGKQIRPTGMVYLLLNKPQGVLSATEDRRARTVLDLIREPFAGKLFPVGRLDKDTEGLLLLTNDGMLAHNLLSPRKHVYKVYFAVVEGEVTREDEQAFLEGVDIGEKNITMPAVMRRLSVDGDFLWAMKNAEDGQMQAVKVQAESGETAAGEGQMQPEHEAPSRESAAKEGERAEELAQLPVRIKEYCLRSLTLGDYSRCGAGQSICVVALREGKFHQIKRMFEAVGKKVTYLKRVAMGPLVLDQSLAPGQYRKLTAQELDAIRN